MGMDVYGLAHKTKLEALNARYNDFGDDYWQAREALERTPGFYFRANVWSWRPLWRYACEIGGDLIGEGLARACHYNDGKGLDDAASKRLAARIYAELESGGADRYLVARQQSLDAMPDEPCELCDSTGVRTDTIGVEMGMPTRDNPHTGCQGWCNGCDGKSTVRPNETHYGFDRDHLREFADFLAHCGGFEVW